MIKILVDGEWIEGTPIAGQEYRKYDSGGGFIQSFWVDPPPTFDVTVSDMAGLLSHSADFTRATCSELTNIVVTGNAGIPSRSFAMPVRRDDGRLFLFAVTTDENGDFAATLNFPTSGQFTYGPAEANIDLPYPMFNVATYRFDVVRNVPA